MPDLEYETPDQPTATTEAPAEETVEAPAQQPAQPRDASGRFVKETIEDAMDRQADYEAAESARLGQEWWEFPDSAHAQPEQPEAEAPENVQEQVEDDNATEAEETPAAPEVDPEVAALRAQVDALTARLEEQSQPEQPAPQTAYPPLTHDERDMIAQALDNDAQATIGWMWNTRPDLYNEVIEIWGAIEPFKAAQYDNYIQRQIMLDEINSQVGPTLQESAEAARERGFQNAWFEAVAEDPELTDIHEQLVAAAEKFPVLAMALESEDPRILKGAFQALKSAAKGLGLEVTKATQPVAAAAAEQARQAKIAGTQPRGNLTNVEDPREAALRRYKDSIVKASSTDISSGWSD